MATKVKLAEATKELGKKADEMLEDSSRVRKSLDSVIQGLRRKRNQFRLIEEEEQKKKKLEEQQLLMSQHTKAWVMMDDEQRAAVESAAAQAESAPAQEQPAPEAEKPKEQCSQCDADRLPLSKNHYGQRQETKAGNAVFKFPD